MRKEPKYEIERLFLPPPQHLQRLLVRGAEFKAADLVRPDPAGVAAPGQAEGDARVVVGRQGTVL